MPNIAALVLDQTIGPLQVPSPALWPYRHPCLPPRSFDKGIVDPRLSVFAEQTAGGKQSQTLLR